MTNAELPPQASKTVEIDDVLKETAIPGEERGREEKPRKLEFKFMWQAL